MIPVIALVGRPNVGKSTLFNRLTGSRDALVADMPGLTRDRQYGSGKYNHQPFIVIDTGGLTERNDGIESLIVDQALQAVEEADVTLFLVDGRDGLTPIDETIAAQLRAMGKELILVINKTEGLDIEVEGAEFHEMGIPDMHAISSAHGHGIGSLLEDIFSSLPELTESKDDSEAHPGIRIAITGRPNVGKSTLVNRMLGEDRTLVFDLPGTTRDSIYIPFEREGQAYTLIDTAGVRRKSRINEKIEKFSVIKTLKAIEESDVVILLLDATEGITEQDLTLLGHILDAGRALVIAINKWDGLAGDHRDQVKAGLERKLTFIDFADEHYISALHGSGVGKLYGSVKKAYHSATKEITTAQVNSILENAVSAHPPPLVKGRRIKLRYAHVGGHLPPVIIVHGNQTSHVPETYKRYLASTFRKKLDLAGTPIRVEFKSGVNPYRNKGTKPVNLTKHQQDKRRRNKRRVKKFK